MIALFWLITNPKLAVLTNLFVSLHALADVMFHAAGNRILHSLDVRFVSLDDHFHIALGQIAHVADYRITANNRPDGLTKAHALYTARIAHVLADQHSGIVGTSRLIVQTRKVF